MIEIHDKGTYILILTLAGPNTIEIGRLGVLHFSAGHYAYIGSAFGPGGLQARLNHHLQATPKPHWHIDYLRRAAKLSGIWYSDHPRKLEHDWAVQMMKYKQTLAPVPGFGSSDCRCASHLCALPPDNGPGYFSDVIRPGLSQAGTMHCFTDLD